MAPFYSTQCSYQTRNLAQSCLTSTKHNKHIHLARTSFPYAASRSSNLTIVPIV